MPRIFEKDIGSRGGRRTAFAFEMDLGKGTKLNIRTTTEADSRREIDAGKTSCMRKFLGSTDSYDGQDTSDMDLVMAKSCEEGAQVMLINDLDDSFVNDYLGSGSGFMTRCTRAYWKERGS